MDNNNHTLAELVENGIQYDSSWGIYADECHPDAEARIGQTQFEQGGLLDGKHLIANGVQMGDALSRWFDGDDSDEAHDSFDVAEFIEHELCDE